MNSNRLVALHALLALAAGTAAAQSDHRSDVLNPQARVPAIEYRSAFSSYQAYRDSGVADWRESNDQVGRLGGHAGHTAPSKGATGKPPAIESKAVPAPGKSSTGGHEAHR